MKVIVVRHGQKEIQVMVKNERWMSTLRRTAISGQQVHTSGIMNASMQILRRGRRLKKTRINFMLYPSRQYPLKLTVPRWLVLAWLRSFCTRTAARSMSSIRRKSCV